MNTATGGLSLLSSVLLCLVLLGALIVLWRQRKKIGQLEEKQAALMDKQHRLRTLIDNVPDLIYIRDKSGNYLDCNRAFAAFIGRERNEVIGANTMLAGYGDALAADDEGVLAVKSARRVESWMQYYDGRKVLLETLKLPIHGSGQTDDTVLSISRDITRRKHEEQLLRLQTSILDQVVRGRELNNILLDVALQVESAFPELTCSVLLLDIDRQHLLVGAAPSLSAEFNQAVSEIKIGAGVCSFGHAAATGMLTVVSDIEHHDYWQSHQALADMEGFKASWAQPITRVNTEVCGVFAMYYREVGEPDALHMDLIRAAARVIGLAIERQNSEDMLQKLSRAVEQSPSMVLITDAEGTIEYINEEFSEVTGYDYQEVVGKTPNILSSGLNDHSVYEEMWHTIITGKDWHGELQNKAKDQRVYWSSLSISPIVNDKGAITHFVSISEDISRQKATQEQIERLAFYDPLTQLGNRRLFREQLDFELRKVVRYSYGLGMLYLDLDNFKQVNDSLGHDMGDELLVEVADRLRDSLRESDMVARLGGDEFVILVPEVKSSEAVAQVAHKIIERLVEPYQLGGNSATVTASIGITMAPGDGTDAAQLMKNADLAMYRAKQHGRNNYQFFTPEMNAEVMQKIDMEKELRKGIAEQQFELHFQPQWSLLDEFSPMGVEALIRWNHPSRGYIPPSEFIPAAEELGLIVPLGEWVIREACYAAISMHAAGHPVRMAVNLSLRQFRDPNLLDCIREALAESGLPAKSLELELTESMVMDDIDRVVVILQQFKELGISLSIDDFGTGYSSLSYLKRLPLDQLKVDSSFVRDIPHDRNDMEITAAVIAMAHKLGMEVVAEGIETHEQMNFLRENNCDIGQGYLLARPAPLQDVLHMLDCDMLEISMDESE